MSLAAELHQAHKARLQRIAIAAERNNRDALVEKLREIVPEPKPETVAEPQPVGDEWAKQQVEKYKDYWFSIASSRIKVAKSGAPTIREIQRAICEVYEVDLHDLLSARRTANIVMPRQVSMYLAKELTGLSLPRIARATGDRDHTTALHAIRKIKQLCKTDRELASKVDLVRERLS